MALGMVSALEDSGRQPRVDGSTTLPAPAQPREGLSDECAPSTSHESEHRRVLRSSGYIPVDVKARVEVDDTSANMPKGFEVANPIPGSSRTLEAEPAVVWPSRTATW